MAGCLDGRAERAAGEDDDMAIRPKARGVSKAGHINVSMCPVSGQLRNAGMPVSRTPKRQNTGGIFI